jgi:hypothetical protein
LLFVVAKFTFVAREAMDMSLPELANTCGKLGEFPKWVFMLANPSHPVRQGRIL